MTDTTTPTRFSFDDQIFSDLYKDAHGFRPRQHEYWTAAPARKQEIWDQTLRALDAEMARECAAQLAAAEQVERTIANLIAVGAHDRAMAIRWLAEANHVTLEYPDGWTTPVHPLNELEFVLGLPYDYFKTTPNQEN